MKIEVPYTREMLSVVAEEIEREYNSFGSFLRNFSAEGSGTLGILDTKISWNTVNGLIHVETDSESLYSNLHHALRQYEKRVLQQYEYQLRQ